MFAWLLHIFRKYSLPHYFYSPRIIKCGIVYPCSKVYKQEEYLRLHVHLLQTIFISHPTQSKKQRLTVPQSQLNSTAVKYTKRAWAWHVTATVMTVYPFKQFN
jgi:hypothetical protein